MSIFCSTSAVEFCPAREPCRPPPATTITSTMRNWNVNGLLGSPLLWRGMRDDRRHFHNCSALRERRQTERCGTLSMEILGTAITCSTSAGASISRKRSTTQSPNCGTSTPRICTYGTMSSMCAAVCHLNPRQWPHLNKRCRPGGKHVPIVVQPVVTPCLPPWGEESSGPWRCSSRSPPFLALAIVGLRGAEWWVISARAIATVIRSCRNMERSRRSLLHLTAEVPASRATDAIVTR